ncbi:Glycogen synthase [compost metagenome]
MLEKRTLLILASTYLRWQGDPEPGFVHELAKRLTGTFHVIVLCPHARGAATSEIMDGVEVIRYRYAPERMETLVNDGGIVTNLKLHRWKALLVPGFVLMQTWRAWRLCRQRRIDVIHAHWLLPQGLIAASLQFLPGRKIPFVATSHGADLYALRGKPLVVLKRLVLKWASAATVVSSAMLDEVARIGGDAEKVSVHSMGVDLAKRFVLGDPQARTTNELLFVGRLVEKKGLRFLIDALSQVLKVRPDVYLTIAGFGPEEDALKAQVKRLSLEHAVRFLGAVPQAELPALYQRAALFIAPFVQALSGDQEGLGLVLVEAIGCGCPVLAGRVPALAEVLDDEFDDLAFDPRDTAALVGHIILALSNPVTGQIRAQALRKAIADKFDWDGVRSRYAALLTAASEEHCNE